MRGAPLVLSPGHAEILNEWVTKQLVRGGEPPAADALARDRRAVSPRRCAIPASSRRCDSRRDGNGVREARRDLVEGRRERLEDESRRTGDERAGDPARSL